MHRVLQLVIPEHVVGKSLRCFLRRGSIRRGVIATVVGSIVYRFIYALVLKTKIVPIECLKLVTAFIVGLAIAMPTIRSWISFQRRKAHSAAGRDL